MKMGFGGIRLCLSLLLAFALISSSSSSSSASSRNTIHPFSVSSDDHEMVTAMEGRLLMARLNDYEDPSANRGHDPPSGSKARARKVGDRRKG